MLYLPVDWGRQATRLTLIDVGFPRTPVYFGDETTNHNMDRVEDRLDHRSLLNRKEREDLKEKHLGRDTQKIFSGHHCVLGGVGGSNAP
jgi:hypothetical protein